MDIRMDEERELLEVVDRHDRPIGQASRGMIHRLGLRHRAVHIFVFAADGRLYLQLRGPHKDQYPGHWDTSAAGHVAPGESYATAALRELAEELGLQEELQVLGHVAGCVATGWEHVALFQCRTEVQPVPNPGEIDRGAFFSLTAIDGLLQEAQWPFTPAFRLLYGFWKGWKSNLDQGRAGPAAF